MVFTIVVYSKRILGKFSMKIIILGAGQVGTTLAEQLATEHNDITIIDMDDEKLRVLQEKMDIQTITGHAAHPSTLSRAGAEDADILIAVTSSDETNMVACQVAYSLFQVPTKIARIRSLPYLSHDELFGASAFPIDVLISPEQLVTNYIQRLIEHPRALQVFDFANQKVQLVAVRIKEDQGSMVDLPLRELNTHLSDCEAWVPVIFRDGTAILPDGCTVIEVGDEVFFLAEHKHVRKVMSAFIKVTKANQRILIAGGGNIGTRLSAALEDTRQVKIIERSKTRIQYLATYLSNTVVLEGDASDKELLLSENIEDMDVFCAITDSDETNIMSSLLAKRLGARKVMTLIKRPSYLDLVENSEIDIIISPQQATIGSLLTHIRRGQVVNVHSLRGGLAEAIELIVDEHKEPYRVVGKPIKSIELPEGTTIGMIVRDHHILMPNHNQVLQNGDRVIVILADKRKLRQLERLFRAERSIFS